MGFKIYMGPYYSAYFLSVLYLEQLDYDFLGSPGREEAWWWIAGRRHVRGTQLTSCRENNLTQPAVHLPFSAGGLLEKMYMEVKYHVKRPGLGETPRDSSGQGDVGAQEGACQLGRSYTENLFHVRRCRKLVSFT